MIRAWPQRPDLLRLQASDPRRYPGLFVSSGDSGWDILFAFPRDLTRVGAADGLEAMKAHPAMGLRPCRVPPSDGEPPFAGGWLCAFAYELGGVFEPSVGMAADPDFPLAWLVRIPAAILVERASGRCLLVAEPDEAGLVDAMADDLTRLPAAVAAPPAPVSLREDDPAAFLAGVARIQDYIRAGDVFQVNLSRGWEAEFPSDVAPAALLAQLLRKNPAPFSALLQMDDWAIVSSSPERLVRLGRDGVIETRPIAGTHPRSEDPAEDAALRARLEAHPKERAEHVMLVDLERNDLGRVCEPGSVQVAALMEIASYRHVHHIESTVCGRLRADSTVFDALRAVFPGGTITGCPKVRTMQIIRELERTPRRSYTGSIGYINRDGSFDFNILIRSFLLRGRRLSFRAGAGIVADSDAARELDETRAKARGLLRALEPA
ncbi:aminodeoxychorismate synthase component I [Thiobacillus sedimenti]|uniref:Aminodeoxychorismate synthase component I n=1 Tax=Thiobacillus sedimenti TaxID=3110231 RepID=A0ABZ1CLV3_9PROT|nr:aminodeoxychorismate synthase component I [Thiobacillus sp. SCUT-2]WRS40329.1 aminodeoxychorismate synthase component I [Thiobacillus sp. SCUT-2]